MGFQDLRLFNLALLAKQGWRLQTNSSSLFYRVYEAKYFPSYDFVDADPHMHGGALWQHSH